MGIGDLIIDTIAPSTFSPSRLSHHPPRASLLTPPLLPLPVRAQRCCAPASPLASHLVPRSLYLYCT